MCTITITFFWGCLHFFRGLEQPANCSSNLVLINNAVCFIVSDIINFRSLEDEEIIEEGVDDEEDDDIF